MRPAVPNREATIPPKKRVILVLGPPRSGTSVVAHVLSEMGVYFGDPDRFVDPLKNTHNPIFFELQSLNILNDAIFSRFGRVYSNFNWLPSRSTFAGTSEFGRISKLIEEELGLANLIGLKDPRFCFTLPLWQNALDAMGYAISYVVTQRAPMSVFKSNNNFNGLSESANFRLVALSELLPEMFLAGNAAVSRVRYEELVKAPEEVCNQLAESLRLPATNPNVASTVVNPALDHEGLNAGP